MDRPVLHPAGADKTRSPPTSIGWSTISCSFYNTMISTLKQIQKVAKEKEWKPGWSLQWIIGGSGADLAIVNPYRSCAEMADPETPFPKLLAEALGSEQGAQDLLTQFWKCFEGGEYRIVTRVPDLSTPE